MRHSSYTLQAFERRSMRDTWNTDIQSCATAASAAVAWWILHNLLWCTPTSVQCSSYYHPIQVFSFTMYAIEVPSFTILPSKVVARATWKGGGGGGGLMLKAKHLVTPAESAQFCLEPSHRSARSLSDLGEPPSPPCSCTPARATYKIFPGNTVLATCAL